MVLAFKQREIIMKNRNELLKELTRAINSTQSADCTIAQVDYWVGCDANNKEIENYIDEVVQGDPECVTYKDIFNLWDEK